MKRKKLATMLIVAFAISATSVAPVIGADDITRYDCDYKPYLSAGVTDLITAAYLESQNRFYWYWTTASVNIRSEPNINSKIIDTLDFNTKIDAREFNSEWSMIKYNNEIYYINNSFIQEYELTAELYSVPYTTNKTWMSYTTITSRTSKQYKLQHSIAYTGTYGIRMINGRYCVALGSHFGCEIGQYFDLILENGTVIKCIMADQKSDKHTDSRNIITVDTNCMSEFIVDKGALNKLAKRDGDISSCCEEWQSHVVKVRVYDKVVNMG